MAKVQTNHMTELGMTKDEMVNTILCLTGLEDTARKDIAKMTIVTLNALYESLSNSAMHCNKAQQEARYARELLKVEEARNRSLARDLRKAERKLKEGK